MKSRTSRRRFLKGAGSVLIGLPLVEELLPRRVGAQQAALPNRCITMSFGLGIEQELQQEGFNGPLEPLKNVASKAVFFSNLTNHDLASSGTVHFNVGGTQFTGVKQAAEDRAGGPSLEQIMRKHFHPGGVPSVTGVPSASAGMWSRTGAIAQYVRHWNEDGSPGEKPERRPSKVFDRVFGSFMPEMPDTTPDPVREIEQRIQRSVLDTVIDQHNFLISDRSFLGAESKARIASHLDAIRQVELQLVDGDRAATVVESAECQALDAADYTDPDGIDFYDAQSGGIGGPKVDWQIAQQAMRLHGDIFALGLACDALRFGSLIFVGAGGHIRFQGNYQATGIGKSLDFTSNFDSRSPHDGIFHNYVKDSVRVYQHYAVSQLAYVVDKMDSIVESNGQTLLDNTLVVMGTEYARNHDDAGNIFHAVIGGNGKFKPGQHDELHTFSDVYYTALRAYDIETNIPGNEVPGMLA